MLLTNDLSRNRRVQMRSTILFPTLLLLAIGIASAQQELPPQTDQGPLTIKPVPAGQAAPNMVPPELPTPAPSTPDADGVYRLGPEITPPILTTAVPAAYPPDAAESDRPHISILAVIVGVDGLPTGIHAVNPNAGPFQDSAIAAVQQSKFQPGMLNGKPVPVLIHVRVPFFHLAPAIPKVQLRYAQFGNGQGQPRGPMSPRSGTIPPKPIHVAMAEYSEQARRQKIQGNVTVSVLVNEDGVPIDPRIEKPLGYGLDEKALEAALQYQFRPAMRDGQPVAQRIMIEVSFKLY
jgi:TonB family protein